jgi:5-hydroxyisourate hydrolase
VSLSTHVLDGARGVPAVGVPIRWERLRDGSWEPVAEVLTAGDGRVSDWGGQGVQATVAGTHRLVFGSGDYFARQRVRTFYPEVVIVFEVSDPDEHHHVPLLLSPFAYSTYRGS